MPLAHLRQTITRFTRARYLDLRTPTPSAKVLLQIKQGYLSDYLMKWRFPHSWTLGFEIKCLLNFKPVQGNIITYGNTQKYRATGNKYCGINISAIFRLYWHDQCHDISVIPLKVLPWWHWAQPEQNYWSIYLLSLVGLQSMLGFIPPWWRCQHNLSSLV